MTVNEIRTKIETVKSKISKAEGVREQILESLKEKYDVSTIEEAEDLLAVYRQKNKKLQSKQEDLQEKLEALVDWSSL